jgi:hypothetical protein
MNLPQSRGSARTCSSASEWLVRLLLIVAAPVTLSRVPKVMAARSQGDGGAFRSVRRDGVTRNIQQPPHFRDRQGPL